MFSVSQVTKLRKELNELKKKTESCSVDKALMALQALVGRSPALFDSYAAIAALEEVVFHRLLQLGEQGDPHMDTEEVVSPEDVRTVASWAICSVRAQRLRHLNASRFLV